MRSAIRKTLSWMAALGVAAAAGCGGAAVNAYQAAMVKQESCCDRLGDTSSVSSCREAIPRVDNPAAETSPVNQDTFGCIDRYFECDASTGRATQSSAQAQLDCITDLGSSP